MEPFEESIRPVPSGMKIASKHALFWPDKRSLPYVLVACQEHKTNEFVRQDSYFRDLANWYVAELHPRFSISEAFRSASQSDDEIVVLSGESWGEEDPIRKRRREALAKSLKASRTPEAFLQKMHPDLFITFRSDERDYRVTNAFKEKFDKHAFTIDDFFTERNQEFRRLILRSGLPIQKVLERMTLVGEDEEGRLYDLAPRVEEERRFVTSETVRYLYVKCPSTGQEYLLMVPGSFTSPKEARRWTFDLPADADFVKEA